MATPEKVTFERRINAPAEKVYKTMIHPDHYREWTAVFNPASRFEGSWEEGSKILFIGADADGNEGGMVSKIRSNIPNKYISIEHLGVLNGKEEITTGPEVESWAGGQENYTFKEENGQTVVKVEMDLTEEFKDYFDETWPKALDKLKTICESK